jgi:NAD+ synthase
MDYMENEKTDEDQLGASYDELEWAMLDVESGSQQLSTDKSKSMLYTKN